MAGNLGGYQTATTIIKRLGGPKAAAGVLGAVGTGLFFIGGLIGSALTRKIDAKKAGEKMPADPSSPLIGRTFETVAPGTDASEKTLSAGEKIKVMFEDGDAVMVELVGDDEAPHWLSRETFASMTGTAGLEA